MNLLYIQYKLDNFSYYLSKSYFLIKFITSITKQRTFLYPLFLIYLLKINRF